MDRPTSFQTRKGHRVVRLPYRYKGQDRHSDDYVYRVKREGRNHYFKLGSEKKAAGKQADEIASFLSIGSNSIDDAIERYAPEVARRAEEKEKALIRIPTIGEICERYIEKAVHLSPATVRNNCSSLRHLAAAIEGYRRVKAQKVVKLSKAWRAKVDQIQIDRLTLKALEDYRGKRLREVGQDGLLRARVITTTNSHFRAARSVFAERILVHYEDFVLPDPLPLRQIRPLREPSHRYVSKIDLASIICQARERWWDGVLCEEERELRAVQEKEAEGDRRKQPKKSSELLKIEERGCFIIILLTAACGLRPKEVSKLLWENVDFESRRIFVAVTSYDTPKARNSEGCVDLSPEVAGYLEEYKGLTGTSEFVLPKSEFATDEDPTQKRSGHLFAQLRAWLRKVGVDHHSPLYIFRKEAGSLVYSQTDSIDRTAEFLRNDPRVAREHYIARKGRLEVDLPGLQSVQA